MPASTISRLQTPLQQFFLRKLSANFRPMGKVGEVQRGQRAWRSRVHSCCGIVITEVNQNNIANHTVEICQEATTAWTATGGTPAGATVADGNVWTAVDYAAASVVTPGIVPVVTPAIINGSNSSPPALGSREVVVP